MDAEDDDVIDLSEYMEEEPEEKKAPVKSTAVANPKKRKEATPASTTKTSKYAPPNKMQKMDVVEIDSDEDDLAGYVPPKPVAVAETFVASPFALLAAVSAPKAPPKAVPTQKPATEPIYPQSEPKPKRQGATPVGKTKAKPQGFLPLPNAFKATNTEGWMANKGKYGVGFDGSKAPKGPPSRAMSNEGFWEPVESSAHLPPLPKPTSLAPNGQSDPELSTQQRQALELVRKGENIFFTGCAGTGKSTLLRHIMRVLPVATTFVTASTGVAAVNIGGTTLHCFAGIGKGEGSKVDLAHRAMKSRARMWWEKATTLVIDEVSMVDAELFEKIDYVGRVLRKKNKPFGGLQVILCGDFLQLPPVSKSKGEDKAKFCFESPIWKETIKHHIELTEIYRQSESKFIHALDVIRHGNVTDEVMELLEASKRNHIDTSDGIQPTLLYALNKDVDETNNQRLDSLFGEERMFRASDQGTQPFLDQMVKSCQAPFELRLKAGAQNLDVKKGLVSGARGVVVSFDDAHSFNPRVAFSNGRIETLEPYAWTTHVEARQVASRTQIPLKLAWALSIHKCQGQTLDRAEMKLSNLFECGQAYVALSRVSSLKGLKIIDFDMKSIKADPRVLAWYRNFENNGRKIVAGKPRAPALVSSQSSASAKFNIPSSKIHSSVMGFLKSADDDGEEDIDLFEPITAPASQPLARTSTSRNPPIRVPKPTIGGGSLFESYYNQSNATDIEKPSERLEREKSRFKPDSAQRNRWSRPFVDPNESESFLHMFTDDPPRPKPTAKASAAAPIPSSARSSVESYQEPPEEQDVPEEQESARLQPIAEAEPDQDETQPTASPPAPPTAQTRSSKTDEPAEEWIAAPVRSSPHKPQPKRTVPAAPRVVDLTDDD